MGKLGAGIAESGSAAGGEVMSASPVKGVPRMKTSPKQLDPLIETVAMPLVNALFRALLQRLVASPRRDEVLLGLVRTGLRLFDVEAPAPLRPEPASPPPPAPPPDPPRRRGAGRRQGRQAGGGRRTNGEYFSSKADVFAAIDHQAGGLVSRCMELLDDGSPILRELSRRLGRGGARWRFRTWRQAFDAVTPPKSHRWRDVDEAKLKLLSEAMSEALSAGGGGVTELSRAGINFPGLPLPEQTEKIIERERWAREGAARRSQNGQRAAAAPF